MLFGDLAIIYYYLPNVPSPHRFLKICFDFTLSLSNFRLNSSNIYFDILFGSQSLLFLCDTHAVVVVCLMVQFFLFFHSF